MYLKENVTSATTGYIHAEKGTEVTVVKYNDPQDMSFVQDSEGNRFWTRSTNLTDQKINDEHTDEPQSVEGIKHVVSKTKAGKKVIPQHTPGLFD